MASRLGVCVLVVHVFRLLLLSVDQLQPARGPSLSELPFNPYKPSPMVSFKRIPFRLIPKNLCHSLVRISKTATSPSPPKRPVISARFANQRLDTFAHILAGW